MHHNIAIVLMSTPAKSDTNLTATDSLLFITCVGTSNITSYLPKLSAPYINLTKLNMV